jgi:ABC-type Fe3+/spermidine/putrescine transport system ATPase subunit/sulfopyruvate decarboxylase TPP-binding subunit
MARAVVELVGCTRDYAGVRAVAGLDLTIHEGELLSLLGPSGCGKTTTLNLIAGFVPPTAGRVRIDGQDVTDRPAHQRGLGVVFQSYALFPHLSVFENVAFGLRERRTPRVDVERRVRAALALVRLDARAEHRPSQLSGGMQQRVALARALVYEPRVLLLDEPLAALDKKLREEMRGELREIQRSVGITTVFVTHDQAEALGLSDRIAVMQAGRIEQLGAPREIYERPATRFVAEFIGASTVLRGRATAADRVTLLGGEAVRVVGLDGLRAGEPVELAIRPERVRLTGGAAENVVDAGGRRRLPGRADRGDGRDRRRPAAAGIRAGAGAHRARRRPGPAAPPAAGGIHAARSGRGGGGPMMTGVQQIVTGLEAAQVTLVASVPDTWIGRLMEGVRRSGRLRAVDVAREEEAVAVACGANLAGGRGAVLIQNAGLLNCGGVLAGLVELYHLPCFFVVSLRGDHRDPVYYHAPKGRVTEETLRAWRLPYARADRRGDLAAQVKQGVEFCVESRGPFVLLISGEDLA